MACGWCGAWRGVRMVTVNGLAMPSPVPGVPLHLCPRCWGVYKETGVRSGIGGRPPAAGPVTGLTVTSSMLSRLGRGN